MPLCSMAIGNTGDLEAIIINFSSLRMFIFRRMANILTLTFPDIWLAKLPEPRCLLVLITIFYF